MAGEASSAYNLEVLESVNESDVQNFIHLLEALDGDDRYTPGVPSSLRRAVDSETTTVYVIRDSQDSSSVSTATLSRLPVISERGRVFWIDDVVTVPRALGHGFSKRTMDAMEDEASRCSERVLLTSGYELSSGTERTSARAAYAKRGYELFPNGLAVYRNNTLSAQRPEGTATLFDYNDSDVESIADLLHEKPINVETNLQAVLNTTHAAVLVRKRNHAVAAVAVANLTPIPTGFKPWIDDAVAGNTPDLQAVIGAAEHWISDRGGPYANMVRATSEGLSEAYQQRSSGLFIKEFRRSYQ